MTCRCCGVAEPTPPQPTDPCPCGSGKPYGECCGRHQ
ncbi:MAG: hypothetical protein C7B45_17020 [Sulfobacillus acidophilus]|uniref:Preprotein translocase subunit SecA n=1 Tax=Sulfobacillus acidophilus TaxID=53633 RepID=A0A2T2WCP8_9FIRM|nr:MAG: hypothetical protein C7B45_17020 [Sulfobacillus acidophilus]